MFPWSPCTHQRREVGPNAGVRTRSSTPCCAVLCWHRSHSSSSVSEDDDELVTSTLQTQQLQSRLLLVQFHERLDRDSAALGVVQRLGQLATYLKKDVTTPNTFVISCDPTEYGPGRMGQTDPWCETKALVGLVTHSQPYLAIQNCPGVDQTPP